MPRGSKPPIDDDDEAAQAEARAEEARQAVAEAAAAARADESAQPGDDASAGAGVDLSDPHNITFEGNAAPGDPLTFDAPAAVDEGPSLYPGQLRIHANQNVVLNGEKIPWDEERVVADTFEVRDAIGAKVVTLVEAPGPANAEKPEAVSEEPF